MYACDRYLCLANISIMSPVDAAGGDGVAARSLRLSALVIISVAFAACSTGQPAPPTPSIAPVRPDITGVASWYGPGFNGHHTSSGAIYHQEDLTAASTLFPLGSSLMVTDLDNGRTVEVIVNDHGPYVRGRELDLSERAARVLGMIGPGTARVRMEVLRTPVGGPAIGQRYFVQTGSFADAANAQRMRERLAAYYSDVQVMEAEAGENRYYRVRMGAFMSRRAAEERATRLASSGFSVVVITE
jgi:rare lipoprotein A